MKPAVHGVALLIAMVCFAMAGAVMAAEGCGTGLICASDPDTVKSAVEDAGFASTLLAASGRDPRIESSAGGYQFRINFDDCVAHRQCKRLQFSTLFRHGGQDAVTVANKWNRSKRFATMAATKDNNLWVTHEMTTMGGLTRANFIDMVRWWGAIMQPLREFLAAERVGKDSAVK